MNFLEKLQVYAHLTVTAGAHVSPGQYVLLSCPANAAAFGRLLAEEAFKVGARDVIPLFYDEKLARTRLDHADIAEYRSVPEWMAEQRNYYAREGCVSISVISEDPEVFAGADGEKLMAGTVAKKRAFKEFYDAIDRGELRWTIVAYPCEAWAHKIFPDISTKRAVNQLWTAIFRSVRITQGDTLKKWQRHDLRLKKRAAFLNEAQFSALEFRSGLGTALTVGLPEGHIWCGGSEISADGLKYFPNMPTEEIFTMPHRAKTNGIVYASLPLSYQGRLIENFSLTFRDGEVVEYHAERGKETLGHLLATDEGSRRLGEVALIPHNSPISNMGLLFYNTLFDENASCHLALGDCYPNTVAGGEKLSDEELTQLGGNHSANHVDFMIGTPDMSITGISPDGSRTAIFEQGNFKDL